MKLFGRRFEEPRRRGPKAERFDGPDFFTRMIDQYDRAIMGDPNASQPFMPWAEVGKGLADIERRLRELEAGGAGEGNPL